MTTDQKRVLRRKPGQSMRVGHLPLWYQAQFGMSGNSKAVEARGIGSMIDLGRSGVASSLVKRSRKYRHRKGKPNALSFTMPSRFSGGKFVADCSSSMIDQ
jgi:hypothetical protein